MRLALVAVVVFLSSTASAVALDTKSPLATFEAISQRAKVAAHVRVLYQTHRLVAEGKEAGRIVTDSHCEVLEAAFGASQGDTLVITTLGGYYGNIGQKVFGLERLVPNEELAVFLDAPGYMDGGLRVTGMNLGLYRVVDAPSLETRERPIIGHGSSVFPARDDPTPLTLGDFLARAKLARSGR
ncbi:MAG: hypothetical protein IT381_14610 [Deltaproteobacteria bacterium]|nr:hypothetical protein [Deltaproteobacteria bacterium]